MFLEKLMFLDSHCTEYLKCIKNTMTNDYTQSESHEKWIITDFV